MKSVCVTAKTARAAAATKTLTPAGAQHQHAGVANMPPLPRITLICGDPTCAAASPRSCRTPSWIANMPYIPVCV
jgi:hypothetical protein